MQCPSCGFENLPGLQQCARCLSVLVFADVDVTPYRAADRGARIRYWRHRRPRLKPYLRQGLDFVVTNPLYSLRSVDQTSLLRRGIAALLSLIPGLGLVILGQARRGWAYFGVFVACLILCAVYLGSGISFVFFALAAGVQTYAIAECVFFRAERFGRATTLTTGLMIVAFLYTLVYPAVGWIGRGMAGLDAIAGRVDSGPLREGDVLLLSGRWFTPMTYSVGDLVSYSMAPIRGRNWQVSGGISIDRILGGPGDRVSCKDQQLTRNGQAVPTAHAPVVATRLPDFDITVPEEMYFILPSVPKLYGDRAVQDEARLGVSLVPHRDVRGRVWMRVGPPHRIGRL